MAVRRFDWLWYLGVVAVCAVSGFYSGQQTEKTIGALRSEKATPPPRIRDRSQNSSDAIDLKKVLIEHVATIGFGELYNLMESASPDLRRKWLKQIEHMPFSPERTAALTTYYKTLLQLDPPAAIDSVIRSDRSDRLFAIPILFGAAMPAVVPDVARALYQLPQEDTQRGHGPDYVGEALNEWGWFDPVAVARFLEEHKRDGSVHYVDAVIGYWAEADPFAAKTWLDRVDPHHEIQNAELDWLWGFFANDPSDAINYALAHASEEEVKKALGGFIAELLTKSPEAATTFLNQLPSDDSRHDALSDFARWTNGTTDKPSESFGHPADAAAKWLVTLPAEVWPNELKDVLSHWEQIEPDKLMAWLQQLPSEKHDRLVADYVSSDRDRKAISEEEPADSPDLPAPALLERRLGAAMTITDVEARDTALRDFLDRNFGELTMAQAVAEIGQTTLPASTKTYVLKLLSNK